MYEMKEHHKAKVGEFDPAELAAVEARMTPERMCISGFLKPNEQLTDIIGSDIESLRSLGLEPIQIGDRLKYLTDARRHMAGRVQKVTGDFDESYKDQQIEGFLVSETSWMGGVVCPFNYVRSEGGSRDSCGYGSSDYVLSRKGERLNASMLGIHMAQTHDFFQGSTPYRIDPVQAAELLGITPGIDYAPTYEDLNVWSPGGSTSSHDRSRSVRRIIKEYIDEDREQVVATQEISDKTGGKATLYLVRGQLAGDDEPSLVIATETGIDINPNNPDGVEVLGRNFLGGRTYRGVAKYHSATSKILTGWKDQPEDPTYLRS